MQDDEGTIGPKVERLVNAFACGLVIAFWINLYAFLGLFFIIVLPNFGKGDFMHYIRLIIILTIAASVRETIRRRKSISLFLSFNLSLFAVNVFAIWRNWFYH